MQKPSRQAFMKGLLILEGNFAIIGIGYLFVSLLYLVSTQKANQLF